MSLAVDFIQSHRLLKREVRLPAAEFQATTSPRAWADSSHPSQGDDLVAICHRPDCVSALCAALRQPLSGLFAPGLAL